MSIVHDFRAQWAAATAADRLALIGLVLFGVLGVAGPTGVAVAGLMLIAAALAKPRAFGRSLAQDPAFWAVVVLGVYLCARAFVAAAEFPATSGAQWAEVRRMLGPAMLLVVAWALRADERRVHILLAAALAGLLLEFVIHTDWSDSKLLAGRARGEFGYTELAAGHYGAVALVGVLAFFNRVWNFALSRSSAVMRWLVLALLLGALVSLLHIQLMTQSRAIWISLVVLVPVVVLVATWGARADASVGWKPYIVAGLTLLIVASLGAENISQRLRSELPAVEGMVASQFADIPDGSIGTRVQLLQLGMDLTAERPWFGWGPGTNSTGDDLVARFGRSNLDDKGDLHNLYLEIAVRGGVTGLILYVLLVGLLIRSGWRGYKAGNMSRDTAVFLATAIILTAMFSMTNERLTNTDFRYFLTFLFGVVHTYGQPRSFARRPSVSSESPSIDKPISGARGCDA